MKKLELAEEIAAIEKVEVDELMKSSKAELKDRLDELLSTKPKEDLIDELIELHKHIAEAAIAKGAPGEDTLEEFLADKRAQAETFSIANIREHIEISKDILVGEGIELENANDENEKSESDITTDSSDVDIQDSKEVDTSAELVDVIIKNGKVEFIYSDKSTEIVNYKQNMREIVTTILRQANYDINIANKPNVNKEATKKIKDLTYIRLCRITLELDSVQNQAARELLNKPLDEVLESEAVDMTVIKNIADTYCEREKIGRL